MLSKAKSVISFEIREGPKSNVTIEYEACRYPCVNTLYTIDSFIDNDCYTKIGKLSEKMLLVCISFPFGCAYMP